MLLGLGVLAVLSAPGEAQVLKKIKEKTKERVEQKTEEGIEKGLDALEGAIECLVGDRECIAEAEKEGKPVVVRDEDGNVVQTRPAKGSKEAAASAGAASAGGRPGEGAWANYDFIPGERPLLIEEYEKDNIGDFPRRFEFRDGSLEIVDWQGRRLLRSSESSSFYLPLSEPLPARFTIEFDYLGELELQVVEEGEPNVIRFDRHGLRVYGGGVDASGSLPAEVRDRLLRGRVMADGAHLKVYIGEKRLANVPNSKLGRSPKIRVLLEGSEEEPAFLGAVRIAAGGRTLYDALNANGRVATQGILFDTNSDVIRPESTPTLKEIAGMLRDHPELRLLIEGHTDAVGVDAANLTLSDRRAAAVKRYLVSSEGIEGSRLETKGFGETNPAASNDTPEGRQLNRRVELVKL